MSKFECKTEVLKTVIDEASKANKDASTPVPLVGSIDQGTSSTRFLLFTTQGRIAASAQMEHTQIFPPEHVGRHEHDPIEIWQNTLTCMKNVIHAIQSDASYKLLSASEESNGIEGVICLSIKAIGITNQRETTVAWNEVSGKPYYNAVVWDDLRTTEIAVDISKAAGDGDKDCLRAKTGLPLASYFAGTKVNWLINNVAELQEDLKNPDKCSQVRFGTIDCWLVHQLTGSSSTADGAVEGANVGGLFVTDVTNASRWLLMDLETMQWDASLIKTVCSGSSNITPPLSSFPTIMSSSEVYGECAVGFGEAALEGIPISGILGDQQAALFGQGAFQAGEAKNTYGTGLFLMMNTGTTATPSTHGLLTTVGYRLGNDDPVYALEGSVSHSGSTIQWLRDQLQIIDSAPESETFARKVASNDGLYFVPAFAGLFAPYWRSDARACIVGMTASHNKNHICRAALESAAYQTKDVFDAIDKDSNVALKELRVDGGGTANSLLMQFQADMISVPVVKPVVKETTGEYIYISNVYLYIFMYGL